MFHPLTPLAPDAETSMHGVCKLCIFLQNSGVILIGRSDRKTRSITVILPRANSVSSAFPLCRSLPSDGAGAVEQSGREAPPTEACPELGLQTRACCMGLPWGNSWARALGGVSEVFGSPCRIHCQWFLLSYTLDFTSNYHKLKYWVMHRKLKWKQNKCRNPEMGQKQMGCFVFFLSIALFALFPWDMRMFAAECNLWSLDTLDNDCTLSWLEVLNQGVVWRLTLIRPSQCWVILAAS